MKDHVYFEMVTYEIDNGKLVPITKRMIKLCFKDYETIDEIPESVRTAEVIKQFRAFKGKQ